MGDIDFKVISAAETSNNSAWIDGGLHRQVDLLRLIWKDIKIFQTQQRENNWKTFDLPCDCSGWRQREDHQACSSNLHRLLQGDWMLGLVFLTNCANKKSRLFKDNPLFAQGRKNKSSYKQ